MQATITVYTAAVTYHPTQEYSRTLLTEKPERPRPFRQSNAYTCIRKKLLLRNCSVEN